jgi:DNA-directed RNA polymerase I subunit RPA1
VSKDGRFYKLIAFPGATATSSKSKGRDDGEGSWCEVTLRLPSSSPKVLMLSAAERAAGMAPVRQSPGLTRAFVTTARCGTGGKEAPAVITVGENVPAVWELCATLGGSGSSGSGSGGSVGVDVNRLNTNSIGAMLKFYGVEAARGAIVRELGAVFSAYGINVDSRHLSLVADYMTQGGAFRPMNRAGIEGHGSPLLKMSFETTGHFLTAALLRGEEGTTPARVDPSVYEFSAADLAVRGMAAERVTTDAGRWA